MPKKNISLEEILQLLPGQSVPGPSQLPFDPGADGASGVLSLPVPTAVESRMAKALSPVKTSSASQPKIVVPKGSPDDLGNLPPEEHAQARERQNMKDVYGFDKEHIKQLILEQEKEPAALMALQDSLSKHPLKPDLRSLAAVLDSSTGGHLAASMGEGETAADRVKTMAGLQGLIQNSKHAATQDALQLLGGNLDFQGKLLTDKAQRFEQAQDLRKFEAANKDATSLSKQAYDFKQSQHQVSSAIQPDENGMVSVGRVQQALSRFARLMGESGALATSDIGRQLSQTLDIMLGDLRAKWGSDPNTKISAKNVAAIADSLRDAETAFMDNYRAQSAAFKSRFSTPGSPYQGVTWGQGVMENVDRPFKEQTTAPSSAPSAQASAAQAELARRRGGK